MELKFIMMGHSTLELVIPMELGLGRCGNGQILELHRVEKSKVGGKMNVVYEITLHISTKQILNY